jgi:hypothetical protein
MHTLTALRSCIVLAVLAGLVTTPALAQVLMPRIPRDNAPVKAVEPPPAKAAEVAQPRTTVTPGMLNPQPLPPKPDVAPPPTQPVGPAPASAVVSPQESVVRPPAGAPTKAGLPDNLFEMDDRAIIVVGGREVRVGDVKRELNTEMRTLSDAGGVAITTRMLEFDLAQPDREDYRENDLGTGIINNAIVQAWDNLSGPALEPVRQSFGMANRLGPGMTARDIEIKLGRPGAIQLAPTGQAHGTMTIMIGGNSIELTSTHPASLGKWMDPRLKLDFDLSLAIDFMTRDAAPHVHATRAVLQPANVRVSPVNLSAELGLSLDEIISSLGGTRTVEARVRDSFAASPVTVTNLFNQQLSAQSGLLSMPPGYVYNGGRVEAGRIVIAGYRVKPAPSARVSVLATWPRELGPMMEDCRPVGIGATWRTGPKPYVGVKPAPTANAQVQNHNRRIEVGAGYQCSTVLVVPQGAPVSITWAEPVGVKVGGSHPVALQTYVAAHPSGWHNPVVPTAPHYALALTRQSRTGTGWQLDAAAEAARSPLDRVTTDSGLADRVQPADAAPVVLQPVAPAPMQAPTAGAATMPAPAAVTAPAVVTAPPAAVTAPAVVTAPAPAVVTAPTSVTAPAPAAVTTSPAGTLSAPAVEGRILQSPRVGVKVKDPLAAPAKAKDPGSN